MLVLRDGINSLSLTRQQALALEVKFNLTEYGRLYRDVGDILYNYATFRGEFRDEECVKTLTPEQLYTLMRLL
jgi:hypothetical protein